MKGYIFEYFKYIRYTEKSLEILNGKMPVLEGKNAILTFGDYDRLMINPVYDFSRFRDLSDLAKEWIGNRQSILLYEMDESPLLELEKNNDNLEFWNRKKNEKDEHLFWALTEFTFRNSIYNSSFNYQELLKDTKEKIENVVNTDEDKQIDYMVMGTLGVLGIAVIWFGNQYTDILQMADKVKKEIEETFLVSYTIISKNPMYNEVKEHTLIDEIKGDALLQVTLKTYIHENKMDFREMGVKEMYHSSGEYDLVMRLDAKDVYKNFENREIFNHQENLYQRNFLQTRVILMDGLDVDEYISNDEVKTSEENSLVYCVKEIEEIKNLYNDVRISIKEGIDKTAGVIDTLDNLLCDYRYNVVSATNVNWAQDFSHVFKRNLQCMLEVLELKDKDEIEVLELLRMIMSRLKQQVFHIAEANSLNFELPKSHLRYTGQEDSIVRCYMGIIKEILKVAYNLEGVNKQSEIVPIVTVDTVPIIESELYFDKVEYMDDKDVDQDCKILSINLPHVAFYNIPEYMQYMYHEIYHYIVPKDREERDYYVGCFCTMNYIQQVIFEYIQEEMEDNEFGSDYIVKYIGPIIYQYVVENYINIHSFLVAVRAEVLQEDADRVNLIGKRYIENLIKYLTEKTDFWKRCFVYLNNKLSDGNVADLSYQELREKYLKGNDIQLQKIKDLFIADDIEIRVTQILSKYEKGREDFIGTVMESIREIYADISMIEFSKMPLEDYLIFYSNALKHKFIKPNKITVDRTLYDNDIKELLRVGIVLDYYKKKGEILDNIRQKFIWKYISKYYTFGTLNMTNQKKENYESNCMKVEKLKEEAKEWFLVFQKSKDFEQFFVKASCLLLIILIDKTRVSLRCRTYNIEEKNIVYFKKYRDALNQYAEKMEEVFDKVKSDSDLKTEKYYEAKKILDEILFQENIKLLYIFQNQSSLSELCEINDRCNKNKMYQTAVHKIPIILEHAKDMRESRWYNWKTNVSSVEGFIKKLQHVTKEIQENNIKILGERSLTIWYRGQENSEYGLLPSIMRSNRAEKRKQFHYLSQYQRYLFEEFKYRADGAPEIMDRSFYNVSDYLALMQHYGVATNLMDWSEDALTALYFAFEKLITNDVNSVGKNASVMIFSPQLYNEARKQMIQEAAKVTNCKEPSYDASMLTIAKYGGEIPNIAAKYNESIYDIFLLGNVKYETDTMYGNKMNMELKQGEEIAYLPMALYTSRLNPRLRSQSGIFLAYNLYAKPSIGNDFSYLELERIQDYYLYRCECEKKEPFLYKIIINKDAAGEFADFLKMIGISKEKIYPELSSIGKRIE